MFQSESSTNLRSRADEAHTQRLAKPDPHNKSWMRSITMTEHMTPSWEEVKPQSQNLNQETPYPKAPKG